MAKILIVEDEPEMALGLKDNFEFDGHAVSIAADGEQGLALALSERPDLIILDLMLPKKSGLDVCRELRMQQIKTPIIMLTARGQEIDKVLGLELGADDYLTKPFSVRELLARVKAVMRRSATAQTEPEDIVRIGDLEINFNHYTATRAGQSVEFVHKEFDILRYFIAHKGQTVSRSELLDQVWGYDSDPTTRTVDNFILKLRKKIEKDPANPEHILTVHGIGYKFIG